MMIRRNAPSRKGVVLLLVLALLSVFGLIVLAYVVLTGHTRRGAEAAKRFQEQYDPPDQTVMQVAMQVLRGTNDPRSSIWCHSLLEDMYGERFVTGVIPNNVPVQAVAGGQLWAFVPSFGNPQIWVGSVITFLHPPLAGISSRVVAFDPVANLLHVVAPESVPLASVNNALSSGQSIGFVLNGRPFSGTGIGFDGSDQLRAADSQGRPLALLPHPVSMDFLNYFAGNDRIPGTADDPTARPLLANEDYDAPDYQNMAMAMVIQDPTTGEVVVPEPSYHRVALIAYWFNQAIFGNAINWGSVSDPAQRFQFLLQPQTIPDPQLRREVSLFERKFILRPLRSLHPDFDGTNPLYQPGLGFTGTTLVSDTPNLWTWDVDNDGDGVPDSIWVDVGLPVRQLPDGRRYKPLAAILCVDLDGRWNLNAHGSLLQTDVRYYQPDVTTTDSVYPALNWLLAAGNDANTDTFPDGDTTLFPSVPPEAIRHWFRGLGFGPAEVNLGPLFQILTGSAGSPGVWQQRYAQLLIGRNDPALGPLAGRYGERFRWLAPPPPLPAPGLAGTPDPLFVNKFFTYPADWRSNLPQPFGPGNPTIYGSPPDMLGLMSVGLDLRGRPIWLQPQAMWGVAATDSPYKIDLTRRRSRHFVLSGRPDAIDEPFSPAELEAALRPFDANTGDLPKRLKLLIPEIVRVRHLITTESWDVPSPSMAGSKRWRDSAGGLLQHIAQRFTVTNPQEWRLLLSPDVAAGLRLDINRPLGDGLDNNTNRVVDDPAEAAEALGGLDSWAYQTASGPGPTVKFDYDSNGTAGSLEDPRQTLARHLYVLMMAVADLGYLDTITTSRTNTARMLAQWAVNVVDFRDRDSIMTRFVFDENPFDGWNPVNDLAHTVWGCERPELLISETLAFHDRRTEDLPDFGYAYPTGTEPKEEEQGDQIRDLDQAYRPQGSLFVELYNPWFENEPAAEEFDDPNKTQPAGQPGVDLAKTNPQGQPIWRIVITRAEPDADRPGLIKDPDDPDPTKRPAIERAVYFVPRPGTGFPEEGTIDVSYYPNNTYYSEIGKILPGQYAVIGPAGQPDGDITYIGFQAQQGNPNQDRYIRILPNQVIVDKNLDTPPAGIKPPVGIRIDRGYVSVALPPGVQQDKEMRLSVSEPTSGYDALEAGETDSGGNAIVYNPATGRYEASNTPQAIDQPLDAQRTDLQTGETWNELFGRNITKTGYRVIHLQRLANPLEPYDPLLNPYRTVDSEPVDLTCFNSRTDVEDFSQDGTQPLDPGDIMFHTRQRGERNDDVLDANTNTIPETNRDFILWKQEPTGKPVVDDPTTVTVGLFNRKLKHTLGYLSEYFGTPRPGPAPYNGDSPRPFPWLTWLNRPFSNPLEILLVPALPSSRLLAYDQNNYYKYYRVPRDGTNPATNLNPYQPNPAAGPSDPDVANDPYPHLLNFFWSVGAGGGTGNPLAPEFHRILEFIRVPSPFVSTELQMNPAMSVTSGHQFAPPNHMIPFCREPGRINLNTVFSPEIFRSILNEPASLLTRPADWNDTTNYPTARFWHEFLDSRRGYGITGNTWLSRMLELNPDYPTRLGNPFRSFGGFSNVPPTNPVNANSPPLQDLIGREVNATLLRAKVTFDANNRPNLTSVPLFQSEPTDPADPNVNHEYEYCDINRNPFFRYQRLMRLGNLVTTRSNVYAIWVTIGYFEVQSVDEVKQPDPNVSGNYLINGMSFSPAEIAEIYPDGYMLGQELGSDTGDIKRHRGFFIFDRSIPVGFRRGYDLNVDQGLLIKRIID